VTRRAKLVPFILTVAIIGFALWWTTGLHFEKKGFDPRADENSEGQCP
jgi:hypothetical protein